MFKNPKDNRPNYENKNDPPPQSQRLYGSQSFDANSLDQSSPETTLYGASSETSSVSRAMTESESLARDIKEGILSGFVGNGTALTGEANFRGMLRVDGRLSGTITSEEGTLIIGNNGQVDANIEVAVATIHGAVNGDIVASKRIEIGRTSKVIGNIQTPSLIIEQGAIFEGSCLMTHPKEASQKQAKEELPEKPSPVVTESNESANVADMSDMSS